MERTEREFTVEEIQGVVCRHFKVKLGDLKSKKRLENIILPRHIAMYLCRKHTSEPSAFIGFKFGGRDHSTVIHALKSLRRKIDQDPWILASILALEKDLQTGQTH